MVLISSSVRSDLGRTSLVVFLYIKRSAVNIMRNDLKYPPNVFLYSQTCQAKVKLLVISQQLRLIPDAFCSLSARFGDDITCVLRWRSSRMTLIMSCPIHRCLALQLGYHNRWKLAGRVC